MGSAKQVMLPWINCNEKGKTSWRRYDFEYFLRKIEEERTSLEIR
jgi:hypothetical protein